MNDVSPAPFQIASSSESLEVATRASGVVEIWLNRPDRMNALGVEMVGALLALVGDSIAAGATALVFRARGRAFCAGADLRERRGMTKEQAYAHNRAINAAANAIEAAPIPTIAAINGAALGGGLELALCCDIRIAAESAVIGLTETRIGAIPGAGGTQRLPRLVGASQALYMMYAGEPVTARRAHEIGLVNDCVADEAFAAAIDKYVETLGLRSPNSAKTLKKVVYEGLNASLLDGLELERRALATVFGSADYAEGLAAFAEKRPPRFSR